MRKHFLIIIALGLAGNSLALNPDIFGYFEPQVMSADFYGEWITLNTNKLRIDLEANPARRVKFGANINYFTYTGKTSYNLVNYIPEHLAQTVYPYNRGDYFGFTYSDSIALDNAYLRLSWPFADITVGKQQISYGSGYAWNPTDIFNLKDQLDPTYEQSGHNSVRLDLPISRSLRLMALYLPGENWKKTTMMGRIKAAVGRYDISITSLSTVWTASEFYKVDPQDQYLMYNTFREGRDLFGFDILGQLVGLGVWCEYAYSRLQYEEDFWEAIAGVDYTFRNGLYILAEGYYNSDAPNSSEDYTLTDWTRYLLGESKTIGQSQAYIYSQDPLTDLINIGGSVIGCINDESIAVVPQLTYSLFQDVELTALGNLFLGEEGTMYSKNLGNGGLIRLRVYF